MHNTPEGHVTRDCKEGAAWLGDLAFRCVDTSGLEPFMAAATLQARATRLTMRMLHDADLALLLLDGRCGPRPAGPSISAQLSRHRKPLSHCSSGPGRNWVSWPLHFMYRLCKLFGVMPELIQDLPVPTFALAWLTC